MIVAHCLPLSTSPPPSKLGANSLKAPSLSLLNSKFGRNELCIKCSCVKEEETAKVFEDFSVLGSYIPWDSGSVWSTMAFYLFSFHVPLSFGGLAVVAHVLHQPMLDPQTQALSLLAIQTLELSAVLWLLRCIVQPQYNIYSFFQAKNQSKERNWFLASVLGFGFLILLVFSTSLLADQLIGPKDVNNSILKEILSSGPVSETASILVYCFLTPLLEEIVYRGFLMTSLASEMKWHRAVVISSAVFSAAHFSGENFLQLFVIGSVLGCSYCWTGNLSAPFVIHSLYNALILVMTYLS
ncbi:uncharacterized protein LOC131328978 [Rhododendron vialii]|uniref:uncharacterized protein LOC131328978 n=1 Tax=Rhododendron vialii TaxID=182163 RepID=UPI00265F7987|nr:uncharacterized protein LOC131328978 [Rhododendron vialii]